MIANSLTIAGFDTSAGAGTLADVKTMSALNVYACAVITAITAQNTKGVYDISYLPKEIISKQIDVIFQDIDINTVKIGMLGNSDIITTVSNSLKKWNPKYIVLDPVMISKHGNYLLGPEDNKTLLEQLIPIVNIITPNIPEAATLIGEPPANNLEDMRKTIIKLYKKIKSNEYTKKSKWVVLKGGHLTGNEKIDMVFDGLDIVEIHGKNVETKNTHGTGCTLSAAITAFLAKGENVIDSVRKAKEFLTESIQKSNLLQVGKGFGPVHHFHKLL